MPRKKSKPAKKSSKKTARKKPADPKKKAADLKKTVDAKKAEKPAKKPKPKSNLNAADRKLFKEMLLQRRSILRGDVGTLRKEGLKEGSSDLSSVPLHLADLGSDAYEQEMTLGLMETESDELQEIEEALERLQDGSFGLCELCDTNIPKMRLKAIPYTRLCIPCKQKEENAGPIEG